MCTSPPGEAKAFTPSVSSTMNSQFRSGRLLAWVITVPTSVTYLVTLASWNTPNSVRTSSLTFSPILRSSASVTTRSRTWSTFSLASEPFLIAEPSPPIWA